jgi:hypothetical protein
LINQYGKDFYTSFDVNKFLDSGLPQLARKLKVLADEKVTRSEFLRFRGIEKPYKFAYLTLLHEIGHTFGLCDMYNSQVHQCDPNLMSEDRPDSVMKVSNKFYLTDDDKAGIRKAFEVLK